MPERERPSLTSLAIKKPLLERGRPVVPLADAETALLGAAGQGTAAAAALDLAPAPAVVPAPPPPPVQAAPVQPAIPAPVQPDAQPTIQSPVLSPSLLKARKKEIRIAWTFKLPVELHEELSAVAAHNELSMSDIVIEAIRFHLPNFPHPAPKARH